MSYNSNSYTEMILGHWSWSMVEIPDRFRQLMDSHTSFSTYEHSEDASTVRHFAVGEEAYSGHADAPTGRTSETLSITWLVLDRALPLRHFILKTISFKVLTSDLQQWCHGSRSWARTSHCSMPQEDRFCFRVSLSQTWPASRAIAGHLMIIRSILSMPRIWHWRAVEFGMLSCQAWCLQMERGI